MLIIQLQLKDCFILFLVMLKYMLYSMMAIFVKQDY